MRGAECARKTRPSPPVNPPTYRPLTPDELAELQPQFVRYLAAQGIPADEWERLRSDAPGRVDDLIARFSAMVFDDVLTRARYLEQRGERQILAYEAGEEVLRVRGVLVDGETTLDLRRGDPPAEMMARLTARGARLKLLAAERAYRGSRRGDLFALLEAGARIATSSELYDLLTGLGGNSEAPQT